MEKEYKPEEINRFELGMDILTRIKDEYGLLAGRKSPEDPTPGKNGKAGSPKRGSFHLPQLLEQLSPLPPGTVLVGACEDDLPVLIDLGDSAAGSVIIAGDPGSGKTRLLRSALTAVTATHTPRKIRFACISPRLEELQNVTSAPHCYRSAQASGSAAGNLIAELAELVRQRQNGSQTGGYVILAIDDLAELVKMLDAGCVSQLKWLVENGAASQVWTFATLDSQKTQRIDPGLLDSFGAWLVGKINPARVGPNLAEEIVGSVATLAPGKQFSAFFDDAWVPFWVPSVD